MHNIHKLFWLWMWKYVFFEVFVLVVPLLNYKDLLCFLRCPVKFVWNLPLLQCAQVLFYIVFFNFAFYIQRWLCKKGVTLTIKFSRHGFNRLVSETLIPHILHLLHFRLSWCMLHTLVSLPALKRVFITLVWALLMCRDYWDQCRHDSWALCIPVCSGLRFIPPSVNSFLSAREEALTHGVGQLAWCLYGNMWHVRTLSGL